MTHPNYTPPPGIREPRRRTWLPYVALAAATILLGVIVASECRAAQEGLDEYETPRTHQLWVCAGTVSCKPQGRPMNSTACALDLASVANVSPKGARLICQRVNGGTK